jgi:hypothetical protein
VQWLKPVILATPEAEIRRRFMRPARTKKKIPETLSQPKARSSSTCHPSCDGKVE